MRRALALLLVAAAAPFVGCATSSSDLASHAGDPGVDSGAALGTDVGTIADDGGLVSLEAGPPYALLAVSPSHGPFVGGTRVELRGRGFSSKTNVRFGPIDVPVSDVVVSDPNHVQVVTPPGEVGLVDVQITDGFNGSVSDLGSAFEYDAYYASPSAGATSGGTHLTLLGNGTTWSAGTTVTIDGKSCGDLVVDDATHIRCTTPKGTPGTKSITVETPDLVVATVRDAFTYSDTDDGYRGGLSGAQLPAELHVLSLDWNEGNVLPSSTVVVRGSDGTELTALTDDSGVASFATPPPAPLTVTITKKCFQPTTFDGVRVQTVTAYLSPVLSVACVPPDGQPPPTGGQIVDGGEIQGELVFDSIEFRRSTWTNVPLPSRPTQKQTAYVWVAQQDNLARFQLPDPSLAVTPDSPGTVGYQFSLQTYPGNATVYAIAGLEERIDGQLPSFEPYAYGLVRGVGVPVNGLVDRVFISMKGAFTHAIDVSLVGPPSSPVGPDRVLTTLAVDVGQGIMVLPHDFRSDLLPIGAPLSFVGVPPLTGPLASATYVVAADDVTGTGSSAPESAILRAAFRSDTQALSAFVPIPGLVSPSSSAAWDGHTVSLTLPDGAADLVIVSVNAADGSTSWTIAAPGSTRSITLPDFSAHPELGVPFGPLSIDVIAAKIDSFVYDTLRYGQLGRGAWTKFAHQEFEGFW